VGRFPPRKWLPRTQRPTVKTDPLSLLGLARRAGGVVVGTDAVRRSIRSGEASLVILAEDASPVQTQKVLRLLQHQEIPHVVVADRNRLGAALGAGPVSAVAVTISSLAEQLRRHLPRLGSGGRRSPDGGTLRDAGS